MVGIENFITFMVAALFFTITPGIDTIFVLNKSIGQGKRSGIYASLGINTGVLMHTLLAALGLSVLIAQTEYGLIVIKYLGAAYLIYLGISKWLSKKGFLPEQHQTIEAETSKSDFWSGFLTNTLNPKVALFFLAFFPQFINPSQIENPLPFVFLGLTYATMGTVWLLVLSIFASGFSQKIKGNANASAWLNRGSALVFILMGVMIVLP